MKEITFDETTTPPPAGASSNTIGEAVGDIARNPSQLVRQWNYKGAIMSGTMRAPIFLVTYLVGRESIKLALAAALAQFIFRFIFAGVGGSLIQAFRRVEPAWKALAAILLIVPFVSHVFEFVVQASFAYLTETADHTGDAIVRSVCFSVLSALFTLFIMRRNVMIVGEAESKSIWSDLARLPVLVFEFVMFIPLEIVRMLRGGESVRASAAVVGFGIFSELIGWAVTGKLYWTYDKGKTSWASLWAIDGLILLFVAVVLSAIVVRRRDGKAVGK